MHDTVHSLSIPNRTVPERSMRIEWLLGYKSKEGYAGFSLVMSKTYHIVKTHACLIQLNATYQIEDKWPLLSPINCQFRLMNSLCRPDVCHGNSLGTSRIRSEIYLFLGGLPLWSTEACLPKRGTVYLKSNPASANYPVKVNYRVRVRTVNLCNQD